MALVANLTSKTTSGTARGMIRDRDYRNILRQELIDRCRRNPRYSLRAFARDIDLDPARLSDVLHKKKGLSRSIALVIGRALGYNEKDIRFFCDLVDSEHARSQIVRVEARARIERQLSSELPAKALTLDVFQIVSEWYHHAILQLMQLPQYREDNNWIAEALGISKYEAQTAIERLLRVGLIERKDERHFPVEENLLSPDGIPSDAIKSFHESLLKKAIAAIQGQPVSERDLFAVLMPIRSSDIELIREKVREFGRSTCAEFSEKSEVDRVVCFSSQLFNLYAPRSSVAGKTAFHDQKG